MNVFSIFAGPVATVLRGIHYALSHYVGLKASSGPAWALSIILLTITVRLLLFPLFVKQIHSQRRMQQLAPQIKELQTRHKGDRETLNTELMKLYKDNNANPISGCLPLVLQLPVFFALFRVMNEFRPKNGEFHPKYGLSEELLKQGAHAKVFGAPISAALNSSPALLRELGGASTTAVRVVAITMIVLMGASTFWTQRQMMARAGAAVNDQQAQVQKFMLYVLPLSFAVFGFSFPIGVLLYWLTTNIWSMGQQHYVIKRMPPPVTGGAAGGGKGGPSGDRKGPSSGGGPAKPGKAKNVEPEPDGPEASTTSGVLTATGTTTQASTGAARPQQNRPAAKRNAGSRKNKKRGKR